MSETGDRLKYALDRVNSDPEFATFSYERQTQDRCSLNLKHT